MLNINDLDDRVPNEIPFVEKGWGSKFDGRLVGEFYAWNRPNERSAHQIRPQTVKVLYFEKGKKLSLHFHKEKEEMFFCALGNIEVITISPEGKKTVSLLERGDRIFIPQCCPHQMRGLNELNILIEVSTLHKDSDSYRIEKGD